MTNESKHGGLRPGAGRKAQDPDNPRSPARQKSVYMRGVAITRPSTPQQEMAILWWKSLAPDERLEWLTNHMPPLVK